MVITMKHTLLVRFGDLLLKGKNKPTFIKEVRKQLAYKLSKLNVKFEYQHDRIYIHLQEDNQEQVLKHVSYVAGIYSVSWIYRTEKDIDKIASLAYDIINREIELPTTFKIETKRTDKKFPLTSLEITKAIGAKLLPQVPGLSVDVHHPKHVLSIEVREKEAILFMGQIKGMGGFPGGLSGKGLVMLSGGIDSPVAAYLAMKQGVETELFHFESTPLTPLESVQKVIDIAKKLSLYAPYGKIKLHLVPFTKTHENILRHVTDSYIITIMRRMMYRLAERFARKKDILAIINGESVGQVASQTLDSIKVVEDVTSLPILRPVVTYDKIDIIKIAQMIDCYDISIRPFNDCCSIYVPRNPVTHPKIDYAVVEETKFDFEKDLEEALNGIVTLTIKPDTNFDIAAFGFDVQEAIKNYLEGEE